MIPRLGRAPGERYLIRGERTIVSERLHVAMLAWPIVQLIIVLIVGFWLTARLGRDNWVGTAIFILILLMLARTLWLVAEWSNERLLVTDKRIILVTGLIIRKVGMMPLSKVTDMSYERSWLGRLLGYGEFVMESAGQTQALSRIGYIPSPDRVYRDVSELLFGTEEVIVDVEDLRASGVARVPDAGAAGRGSDGFQDGDLAGGRIRREHGSSGQAPSGASTSSPPKRTAERTPQQPESGGYITQPIALDEQRGRQWKLSDLFRRGGEPQGNPNQPSKSNPSWMSDLGFRRPSNQNQPDQQSEGGNRES
jgi:membrane protein YdbS with pleckstrin-like domain